SLAAGAERLPRDLLVQQLRVVPGAPHAGALPEREGAPGARPHAEWLGPGDRADPGGDTRELPERGRQRCGTRSAATVYGRCERHTAGIGAINRQRHQETLQINHRGTEKRRVLKPE